ncbi:hypothetical protein GSI_07019 [Ganoderma sinense ZZ0214-1]|uniref:Transporter n=1 Tax=Ganoderma sinense ZZ0214-1 TaxID=1077348 RepID=A0A2G8SAR7_9APHY|nr:hypothetical protein GSI_07019 [Ganoderma sinense ZZ0214-1]
MHFTFAAASALALSFLSTGVTAAVAPRQIVESQHGTTVQPASGSTLTPGAAFSFSYTNENLCHSGYTPISVYLSTSAPTSSDVTTSGGLADGSFVYHFGDYLIANFGLPTKETPPPSTLTFPTVNSAADGQTLYFSVVETYRDCPGGIPLEYGLETTTVVYA